MLAILLTTASCSRESSSAGHPATLPQPASDVNGSAKLGETRRAVFAGGCFWCTEAVFEQLAGITSVVSGYAGDTEANARYDIVSAGRTQHAEAIEITYDPAKISYGTLLRVFFAMHDPTTLDRQEPDYGHQYRSAVFYGSEEEKQVAEAYLRQLEQAKVFGNPIVTTLERLDRFYPAEAYHQDYVAGHPYQPYVVAWALPKLAKLQKLYPELLKSE
jgi:peptide-methionine (S)-S-oxide reductase